MNREIPDLFGPLPAAPPEKKLVVIVLGEAVLPRRTHFNMRHVPEGEITGMKAIGILLDDLQDIIEGACRSAVERLFLYGNRGSQRLSIDPAIAEARAEVVRIRQRGPYGRGVSNDRAWQSKRKKGRG